MIVIVIENFEDFEVVCFDARGQNDEASVVVAPGIHTAL